MIDNHNVELISIHIPKTGGTSLRNTFKDVFGEDGAKRFDIKKGDQIYIENDCFNSTTLPPELKVLHGHFTLSEIRASILNCDNIPIITWLRDPVERVLSNYFYLKKQLTNKFDPSFDNSQMLARMLKTVDEFAECEENINRMSKFINCDDLEKLSFIGFTESYSKDLKMLAKRMGWRRHQEFKHNTTGINYKVDVGTIERIKLLNSSDVELYVAAQKMKKEINKKLKRL